MKKLILTNLIFGITLIFTVSNSQGQNLQISGGNNFSSVVCNQQRVNVTGYNKDGQLGTDAAGNPIALGTFRSAWAEVSRGTLGNTPLATGPDMLPAIRQADAGSGGHLLGLDCNKNVWAWGLNDAGQLGRNNSGAATSNSVPMRVLKGAQTNATAFLANIKYVSGGNNSSFAIEETTGRVLSWGSNDFGQLGDGSIVSKLVPVYVLSGPGTQLTNIVQIEAGDNCTYALDASGQVWSWGQTHDGSFPAYNLGRTNAGEVVAAPGGTTRCLPYAGRVERGTNDNNNGGTAGFLDNMISISGGDTHGLAIDATGGVWSWGGDWATGQIGQGNGGQYNWKAGRVVDIGVTAATGPFLGDGTNNNYKAIAIAAGQSSSAVVLEDRTDPTNLTKNRVVVFGSNGLYEFGNMVTQGSTITCTGNNRFTSGTLGRGQCNGNTCGGQGAQNENANATSYEYPVFVETSAGVPLSGVTTVSDGDAWYFATNDVGGNAVSWGWNRRGEQATGTFADRCYATSLTLPTSCAFDYPCPGQPTLPANFSTCPVFSYILNSQVPQDYTSFKYNWQYRATPGSGAWTDIAAQGTTSGALKTTIVTSTNNITYTTSQIGEYRVLVSDNRTSVAFLCAPCPVMKDSVTISEVPNPYTLDGCSGTPNSTFIVSGPATAKIKWYTALTGGTALNPSDSSTSITVPTTTAPVTAACGAGKRALFAEDVGSSIGFVYPTGQLTPTQAQIETAMSCATLSTNAGNQTYLGFQVFKNVKLTSVSVFFKNPTGNSEAASGTVNIFTNNPASLWNGSYNVDNYSATHVAGSPTAFTSPNVAAGGTLVKTIPLSINLTPGIYWINVNANYNIQPYFNCSPALQGAYPGRWTTPVFDNGPGSNTIAAIAGRSPAQSNGYSSKGGIFDLKFETGTGYSCGRILVCQSNTACVLPVNLLYFTASKSGEQTELNWATASEENSSHFNVQKSADGIHWSTIGQVTAAGNSTSVLEYKYTDQRLSLGTTYYRIVEVDIDGATQISNMESINTTGNLNVSVQPNPNNGNFSVIIQGSVENSLLSLTNSLGQVVYQKTEETGSYFNKEFNFNYLPKGIYHLSVRNSSESKIVKIILE